MHDDLFIAVEEVASLFFTEVRPGCEKAVLLQIAEAQAAAFRIQPTHGIPAHRHSRTRDLFIGMAGEIEIRHEHEHRTAVFTLKPGAFCSIPPGVRHEVRNASTTREALFLLVHVPYEGFDFL